MFTTEQKNFIELVESTFGQDYIISRKEIDTVYNDHKGEISYPYWLVTKEHKVSWGKFKVPSLHNENMNAATAIENIIPMKKTIHQETKSSLIPDKDKDFVPFGHFNDLKNILTSKKFFPVFIAGPSGLGKTYLVEQVCASIKRELVRVNFSVETDQSDLIGGSTLIDGNIVYQEGPVLNCLRNGYVLLLDEIDRSNPNNILILNGILEGKGFYNPKTGEYIKAHPDFNVIVTANSKGYGDETGKYLSQILDSAFLERFYITMEQDYPTEKTEQKILSKHLEDADFVEKLVKWARVIRKTFEAGGIDEIVSLRRLIHIAETYNIFNDKLKSISLCVSRFESHTKEAFIDLYTKIDAGVSFDEEGVQIVETTESISDEDIKF